MKELGKGSYKQLVINALEVIGLRGLTMPNFYILSNEIKRLLNKKVSPITLYRMSNSKLEGYRPYSYNVSLVEDFISVSAIASSSLLTNTSRFFSKENPRETALYRALRILLQPARKEDFVMFFSELPTSAEDIGWERIVISYALGDYIRSIEEDVLSDALITELIKLDQFSRYYLESFVDFDFKVKYSELVLESLSLIESKMMKLKILNGRKNLVTSQLFCYSILPYLHLVKPIKSKLFICHQFFCQESSKLLIEKILPANPILAGRALGARVLIAHLTEKSSLYLERLEELFDVYINAIDTSIHTFERSFVHGIFLDTLIMCDDIKGFLRVLDSTTKPLFGHAGEPQILRLMIYQSIFKFKDKGHEKLLHIRALFSDGENDFHREILKKVLSWRANELDIG